jgi:hypothetical protein
LDDLFTDAPVEDHNQDIDYHSELVGEGKKFKTDADLAKGKFYADKTIETLTKKLDELQLELKTKTNMEDFLTQMKNSQNQSQPLQNDPVQPDPSQNAGINDSDLDAKLEALLAKKEALKSAETNMAQVKQVMSEQFGDLAVQVINKKARDLGMSVSDLQALAQKSPSAFFNLIGVSPETSAPSAVPVPRNSVNQMGGVASQVIRNQSYYEKLKRENPTLYFRGETTVQQIRDAEALGDRYFS